MADHKVKITATSPEQFSRIDESLKKLPDVVYENIESAEINAAGIMCTIRKRHTDIQKVFVASPVRQITHIGDDLVVYHTDYLFKIKNIVIDDKKIDFSMIDMNTGRQII